MRNNLQNRKCINTPHLFTSIRSVFSFTLFIGVIPPQLFFQNVIFVEVDYALSKSYVIQPLMDGAFFDESEASSVNIYRHNAILIFVGFYRMGRELNSNVVLYRVFFLIRHQDNVYNFE